MAAILNITELVRVGRETLQAENREQNAQQCKTLHDVSRSWEHSNNMYPAPGGGGGAREGARGGAVQNTQGPENERQARWKSPASCT